jgi:hypothetical protein
MAIDKIFDNGSVDGIADNLFNSVSNSVSEVKAMQQRKAAENVQLVIQALKKIESDIQEKYNGVTTVIEKRVASIKDGKDGRNGADGKAGKDGRPGRDGATGPRGLDGVAGKDARDGVDGVSVTDAHIDFDGSLIISLSSGRVINVGEVVAPDLAETIKVITNGGGTSQTVIDALASLQTQITNLIPSQTGNSGKYLTTNGTAVSWSTIEGGLSYKGTWNATTNTPTLASGVGTNGYYYVTATAGSTNLDGITDWQIGDWLLFNGTVWQKIDQSNLVVSVAGRTGAITLANTDISGLGTMSTQASSSVSISGGSITGITDLAIADGGTGQSTANAAFNALAPSQTSNANKYLKTDGTNTSWAVVPDPAAATPTDDGLVFGLTSNVAATTYTGFADYVTPYIFFSTANYFIAQEPIGGPGNVIGNWNVWVAANINMGMPIYGQKAGGSKLYYGVVTFITGGSSSIDPAIFYVSNPNNNPDLPYFYPINFTFSSPVSATNGNTSLGYQTNSNGGKNTIVGFGAGSTVLSGYNLTVVGYDSEPSTADVGNEATFGNSATTNTRLFGSLAMGGSSTGTAGQVLTSAGAGTAPTWSTPASSGVSSVTGTSPVVSSGGATPAISLSSGYGDTLNPYASKTANYVLAAPNGSSGVPTFRAVVAADIPTLNQNTTGNAATATNVDYSGLTGTVPTWNQNTTGTAANVTGVVAIANGGTGQTTATTAFNALAPSQTSNSGKYLTTDGTNSSWATVVAGASLSNDTSTTSNLYPLFAAATSGTPTTIYTSNAKYLYKPSTGELQASELAASNGLILTATTVSASYTIGSGYNAFSVGPITVASGQSVTISSGQRWLVQ